MGWLSPHASQGRSHLRSVFRTRPVFLLNPQVCLLSRDEGGFTPESPPDLSQELSSQQTWQ